MGMADESSSRTYPTVPRVGVAGVVIADGCVLLVRRGKEPMRGQWSVPGGVLELGETMSAGVRRELAEETGLRVTPMVVLTAIDRIDVDESGRVRYQYVVVDWLCGLEAWQGMEAVVSGDDAMDARWVRRKDLLLAEYDLADVTLDVIEKAFECVEGTSR